MGRQRRLRKLKRALRGTHRDQQPSRSVEKRPASDWPAPGLYDANEVMKAKFPK
jgi:hypothetical protein